MKGEVESALPSRFPVLRKIIIIVIIIISGVTKNWGNGKMGYFIQKLKPKKKIGRSREKPGVKREETNMHMQKA